MKTRVSAFGSRTRPRGLLGSGICVVVFIAGCATSSLPDIRHMERRANGPAKLEGAHGPLSAQQSKAVLDELRKKKGDPSILGRYGLGKERTVAEWAEAAGLDLRL